MMPLLLLVRLKRIQPSKNNSTRISLPLTNDILITASAMIMASKASRKPVLLDSMRFETIPEKPDTNSNTVKRVF
jgi:hypothetical protein